MKLILKLIKNHKKETFKVVLIALLATFFELLYFVFARSLIAKASNSLNYDYFLNFTNPLVILFGFLITNIISLCLRSYSTKVNIKTAYKISSQYSMNSLKALASHTKYKYFPNQGDYVANVIDFPERTAFEFFIPLFISISSAFSVFFLSIYMFLWVGSIYIYIVIILAFIYLIFYRPLMIRSSKSGKIAASLKTKIINQVVDIYELVSEIDIYKTRGKWFENHYENLQNLYTNQSNIVINTTCPKYLIESLTVISIVLSSVVFSYMSNGLVSITLIVNQVVSIAFASQRLIPYINYIFSGLNSMKGALPALKRLIFDIDFNASPNRKFYQYLERESEHAAIVIDYKIPNTDRNIDLKFKLNKHTSICGPSGSGKTTLLQNIIGISNFSNSKVYFNLKLLNDNGDLQVGYVPQKNKLFSGTIRENILLRRERVNNKSISDIDLRIWECLKITKLDDIITSLPKKLETTFDTSSTFLSGGQIQRLAISRAILMQPKILLMDEATSSLDSIIESEILDNLNELGITIISIAHRDSAIRKSDYQVFIK